MLIEIFKFIGSILLGTGIAVVFVARMHRTSKTIDKPIPFISYYKIDDDINEYEKYIKEDESIEEDTPGGKVFMIYNKDTEQFDYYSNNVIPYRYLEVVARKYVLTYNCLELYIDTKEEYIKLLKESQESEESETQVQKEEGEEESPIDDVFVQYKSYNKQSNTKSLICFGFCFYFTKVTYKGMASRPHLPRPTQCCRYDEAAPGPRG